MWWVPLLRRCHTVRPWPWQQWLGNQIIKHNHIILIMAFQSFKSTVEEGVRGSSEVLMGSFITANPLLLPPHLPWPDISSSGPSISCFRCVQVVIFFGDSNTAAVCFKYNIIYVYISLKCWERNLLFSLVSGGDTIWPLHAMASAMLNLTSTVLSIVSLP